MEDYLLVLKLVKDGWNINEAVTECGFHVSTFYGKITEQQRLEIYYAKKLHTKHGKYNVSSIGLKNESNR